MLTPFQNVGWLHFQPKEHFRVGSCPCTEIVAKRSPSLGVNDRKLLHFKPLGDWTGNF
ncbi:hypothetical protein FOXG_22228 [Fusarium oxysporum f. sp. lycopersici 4287]|uniref:Uncharacterized protein n=1 Tax=Fusarium oxysporum f. sp. lycopersici (strain 4287 / CBS 123668 / FGSC 9935 / NRRL 34936) TaxID=426428 RepID=A0A0J9W6X5_FUSO4|nr:uncharacterized protein FOXG_22228 [Fusarium oxysporum f. sp. lycopersici 4287]KNB18421.1 hypothetical protein FOXG_22228 [Fusarium oxysporum f. sp. lycopersici 4287]